MGADEYNSVRIDITKCKNTTENEWCKPQEVIDETINNGVVQLYISDNYVDAKNYSQPVQKYYSDLFEFLSPEHSMILYTDYSLIEFITDEGLIFQRYEKLWISSYIEVRLHIHFRALT
jgi:hypothetical protein